MLHLVIIISLMTGQPVSIGSKIEPSPEICQADQATIPPQIIANVKAQTNTDITVKTACLDDADYKYLMGTLGLTDEDNEK